MGLRGNKSLVLYVESWPIKCQNRVGGGSARGQLFKTRYSCRARDLWQGALSLRSQGHR
jgi:hypothetical protein